MKPLLRRRSLAWNGRIIHDDFVLKSGDVDTQ
jgi:hypothetical protein